MQMWENNLPRSPLSVSAKQNHQSPFSASYEDEIPPHVSMHCHVSLLSLVGLKAALNIWKGTSECLHSTNLQTSSSAPQGT